MRHIIILALMITACYLAIELVSARQQNQIMEIRRSANGRF